MSMFLDGAEMVKLTGRKRSNAQVEALRTMGVEHIVRPDGVVIVSRSHIESRLDGRVDTGLESKQITQPDWGAINGKETKS